ncbi:MAG TPA: hypothetical protein VK464_07170 [Symbiobacteriaceae bacterium]|nr:hypothetical protein [Symbiobacteriaceae bacterium]
MARSIGTKLGLVVVLLAMVFGFAGVTQAVTHTLTAKATPATITIGEATTITVTASPASAVAYVKVFDTATKAEIGKVGASGQFTWRPEAPGTYHLRAWSYSKGNLAYLVSQDFTVVVKDTDRAALARTVLKTSRVTLWKRHPSGKTDNAYAHTNVLDTSKGLKARNSCYGQAPCGETYLSANMLSAMVKLAQSYSFEVSEIAGGSHSSNSKHYKGLAFDVAVINGRPVSSTNPDWKNFKKAAEKLGAYVLGPGDPDHDDHLHVQFSQ